MSRSANRSTCFVIDPNPGTKHVVLSVLDGMNVASEFFESVPEMLEFYAVVPPDLILIDVTADSGVARGHMEMLVAANVDRPIRIMSGLNGLLTEEIRRSWERGGLKVLSVLAKPLRQQTIKNAASGLQQ